MNINNSPDIDIDESLKSGSRYLHERELKGSETPSFDFELDVTAANGTKNIDTANVENRTVFMQNLRYWTTRHDSFPPTISTVPITATSWTWGWMQCPTYWR